jgi:nicotinate-nucleotide adenylyltransferase
MKRIGIYGGSFNPIHLGHLTIADFFQKECKLDLCYFVPSFVSPFKSQDNCIQEFDSIHRMKMIELALNQNNKFQICDFEILNEGISYTYLTIEDLIEKHVDAEIYLLMGTDQAENFHKWKRWEWITDQVILVIANRDIDTYNDYEFQRQKPNCKVICLKNPLIKISSSEIRTRIKKGLNCDELLPLSVWNYILENNLYS